MIRHRRTFNLVHLPDARQHFKSALQRDFIRRKIWRPCLLWLQDKVNSRISHRHYFVEAKTSFWRSEKQHPVSEFTGV